MKRHLQGTFWGALLFGLLAHMGLASDARAQDYDAYENRTGDQANYQAAGPENDDESYAYIRTIDGTAYLVQAGSYERVEAQINEPVLVGDVIEGKGGSKIELILPDQSRVRITDKAQLEIQSLAMSVETPDQPTVLLLHRGRMQFVADELTGDYVPVIRTPNADVEIERSGTYFIRSTRDDRTTVVTREGRATVRTDVAAESVRETQEVTVRGRVRARVEYDRARGLDSIERWGLDLDSYAYEADSRYVDQRLRYSTASLRGYGRWVPVGGTYAWRPYVKSGWRPYTNGRWRHSSHGLIWVSYDPWGWAPHHYGTWDYSSGYGWVWYPGQRYSNAWVTWYWGPTYVGWTPVGYYYSQYGHHARHRGHRYRHGYGYYGHSFLGHLAGSFVDYARWSFIEHDHIGRRHQRRHTRSGGSLRRVQEELARGVLTTSTEGMTPERVRSPRDAMTVLATADKGRRGSDITAPLGGRTAGVTARSSGQAGKQSGGGRGAVSGANVTPRRSAPEIRRSGEPGEADRSRSTARRPEPRKRSAEVKARPEKRKGSEVAARRPEPKKRSAEVKSRPEKRAQSEAAARRPEPRKRSAEVKTRPERRAQSEAAARRPEPRKRSAEVKTRPERRAQSEAAARRPEPRKRSAEVKTRPERRAQSEARSRRAEPSKSKKRSEIKSRSKERKSSASRSAPRKPSVERSRSPRSSEKVRSSPSKRSGSVQRSGSAKRSGSARRSGSSQRSGSAKRSGSSKRSGSAASRATNRSPKSAR
ncbi:MAG: DUF6600 domain-containing protein [Gemmatimonadota bacterium]